jgi:hypothetical protein
MSDDEILERYGVRKLLADKLALEAEVARLRVALEAIVSMIAKGPFENVDDAGEVIVGVSQVARRALKP